MVGGESGPLIQPMAAVNPLKRIESLEVVERGGCDQLLGGVIRGGWAGWGSSSRRVHGVLSPTRPRKHGKTYDAPP